MTMIEQLVESALRGIEDRRAHVSLSELEDLAGSRNERRPFIEALSGEGLALIAEFKRRSPSSGEIRPGADLATTVSAYREGGASALSVLTEEPHFGGSLDDLRLAREVSDLPILRKDFIVDSYMVVEAAANGADAILLIVAALNAEKLEELLVQAGRFDLDCLVEVHDEKELQIALDSGADLIGVNNRNLRDFSVDIERTFELISDVPAGKTFVSESGVHELDQVKELERIGVDAVLIGEALMKAQDPAELCRSFIGEQSHQP